MKVFLQSGCICDALEVDDVSVFDITDPNKKKEIINYLSSNIDMEHFEEFVKWFAETHGEYDSDDEPCEQCGDWVERYTWEG